MLYSCDPSLDAISVRKIDSTSSLSRTRVTSLPMLYKNAINSKQVVLCPDPAVFDVGISQNCF